MSAPLRYATVVQGDAPASPPTVYLHPTMGEAERHAHTFDSTGRTVHVLRCIPQTPALDGRTVAHRSGRRSRLQRDIDAAAAITTA